MSFKLYIEGGGEGQYLDTLFRKGWREAFERAGFAGRMPAIVRGGSRDATFGLFKAAVEAGNRRVLPLLLVDSEDPVAAGTGAWQHVARRDGWHRPADMTDDQVFLMVQVMETWFLADPGALQRHFGASFRPTALRQWPDLEAVPKLDVFRTLERATSGRYAKGDTPFRLIGALDLHEVAGRCSSARGLLDRLNGP